MSIYGGETIKESAKRLESAPIDIICATPGRLIALLDETKCLDTKHYGASPSLRLSFPWHSMIPGGTVSKDV